MADSIEGTICFAVVHDLTDQKVLHAILILVEDHHRAPGRDLEVSLLEAIVKSTATDEIVKVER